MFAGNSVEQVVPGPDFTAGVKNVTVPEGRLVFNIMIVMSIMMMMIMIVMVCARNTNGTNTYWYSFRR